MKTIFLLFGAPGCGKGYLGDCIKQRLIARGFAKLGNIKYISTGDLLRAEIASNSALGKEIKQIVDSGQFVSDEIVNVLVQNALSGNETFFFIDGYPRTQKQLCALEDMLDFSENQLIAIKRDTPIDVILKRVSNRRICKECGSTHSVHDGKCPKCGGESVVRKDDAVIEKRLAEYETNTEALWKDLSAIAKDSFSVNGERDAQVIAEGLLLMFFS